MSNAGTIWVVSRSERPERALDDMNCIEICSSGPNPRGDAEQYAKDETMATGKKTYIYCVELVQVMGYKLYKEVNAFVPTK